MRHFKVNVRQNAHSLFPIPHFPFTIPRFSNILVKPNTTILSRERDIYSYIYSERERERERERDIHRERERERERERGVAR